MTDGKRRRTGQNGTRERRYAWFKGAREIVDLMLQRQAILDLELCPDQVGVEDEERQEGLRKLARFNAGIRKRCASLDEIEQGKPEIGARALITQRPVSEHLRSAICLLAAARFDENLGVQANTVTEVVSLAGGRDVEQACELREAFELTDGLLRPHVRVTRSGSNLDRWKVHLLESALAAVLGRTCCRELLAIELAYGSTANLDRGAKSLSIS